MNKKGSGFLTISFKYLRHLLRARHRRGHGIHSTFVYGLVRDAISPASKYVVPEKLSTYHRKLLGQTDQIRIHDLGAGSSVDQAEVRSIASIARKSSLTRKQGKALFSLCKWYGPARVIEFGTGLGISTSYLAAGADRASVVTIEGSPEKYAFARENTGVYDAGGLEFLLGSFDSYFSEVTEQMPDRTLVFIDGDHRYGPVMDKLKALLGREIPGEMMIVLDDIYWSDEMERMWKEIVDDDRVNISLDLFHFGILIRRPGIAKQHFRVVF